MIQGRDRDQKKHTEGKEAKQNREPRTYPNQMLTTVFVHRFILLSVEAEVPGINDARSLQGLNACVLQRHEIVILRRRLKL